MVARETPCFAAGLPHALCSAVPSLLLSLCPPPPAPSAPPLTILPRPRPLSLPLSLSLPPSLPLSLPLSLHSHYIATLSWQFGYGEQMRGITPDEVWGQVVQKLREVCLYSGSGSNSTLARGVLWLSLQL